MSQRASRTYRITKRKDIERVFEVGRSARNGLLTVLAAPNGLPYARCAVGVSKRHGIAVRRNRIKRLCREAFRLSREELRPGWDYVLMPHVGGSFALQTLRGSLRVLAPRATAAGDAGEVRR